MGMENDVMLSYLKDNERFADTFNFGYFEGKQVVAPERLVDASEIYHPTIQEICSIIAQPNTPEQFGIEAQPHKTNAPSTATMPEISGKRKRKRKMNTTTRTRDIKKTLHTGQSLKIVAIESQSDINYLMPWRHMDYDSREYGKQIQQISRKHELDYKHTLVPDHGRRYSRSNQLYDRN